MFSIFKDFNATRLVAQYDTLSFALAALTRNNTLVLPEESDAREDVAIDTYGATLYPGPGGANVTLGPEATLFRLAGEGQATIQTANVDSRVYGNDADNLFLGNDARDVLYGGSGKDWMDGGAGNDVFYGGGGDDTIVMGDGRDRAYGGEGDDIFYSGDGQSRFYGGAGNDTYRIDADGDDLHIIYDFEAGDQLILTGDRSFDSFDDIIAAGGQVYQSKDKTIIKIDDTQIQFREFDIADLNDAMINPDTPPAEGEFDSVDAFLASGQANLLDEAVIDGVVYKRRATDPLHEDYKFTDDLGRTWSPDYYVVVAAGQSNMVGSGVGGDFTLSGNVVAYDWVNDDIVLAAYDEAPAGGEARTGSTIRNNLYFPMADQLSADLGQPVLVISHAVSGSRIDTWLESGTGENWAELNPEVTLALDHVGQDHADAFIWHQGESDYPVPTADYKAQALELVEQVRDQDWASDTLPFLFGELSRDGVNFAQNIALQEIELENTDPNIGFVSSAGLITEELSGVHFNGESLNIFGQRYADVLNGILNGVVAPDNTAPDVNGDAAIVSEITIAEGQELRIDMTDYFTDAEGDDLYYYAYLNKRNVYLARADQDSDEMLIAPTYDHAGNYTLYLYANDYNLDGEVIAINLTVTDATPLVSTYNNRSFDLISGSYRDYETGIDALDRNRGLDILDQAAFGGETEHVIEVQTAHIRGGADISARFILGDDVEQSYYYGDAVFDVVGNDLDNYIVGADGGSEMTGGEGRDRLYGNGGDDVLYGGNGDDKLYGGDGEDLIVTERGSDQAYGGAGDDIFVFSEGDEQLYIRDFEAGDIIEMDDFAGINTYDDLLDAALIRDSNGRVIIDIADDRLMLANTAVDDLSDDFFVFV